MPDQDILEAKDAEIREILKNYQGNEANKAGAMLRRLGLETVEQVLTAFRKDDYYNLQGDDARDLIRKQVIKGFEDALQNPIGPEENQPEPETKEAAVTDYNKMDAAAIKAEINKLGDLKEAETQTKAFQLHERAKYLQSNDTDSDLAGQIAELESKPELSKLLVPSASDNPPEYNSAAWHKRNLEFNSKRLEEDQYKLYGNNSQESVRTSGLKAFKDACAAHKELYDELKIMEEQKANNDEKFKQADYDRKKKEADDLLGAMNIIKDQLMKRDKNLKLKYDPENYTSGMELDIGQMSRVQLAMVMQSYGTSAYGTAGGQSFEAFFRTLNDLASTGFFHRLAIFPAAGMACMLQGTFSFPLRELNLGIMRLSGVINRLRGKGGYTKEDIQKIRRGEDIDRTGKTTFPSTFEKWAKSAAKDHAAVWNFQERGPDGKKKYASITAVVLNEFLGFFVPVKPYANSRIPPVLLGKVQAVEDGLKDIPGFSVSEKDGTKHFANYDEYARAYQEYVKANEKPKAGTAPNDPLSLNKVNKEQEQSAVQMDLRKEVPKPAAVEMYVEERRAYTDTVEATAEADHGVHGVRATVSPMALERVKALREQSTEAQELGPRNKNAQGKWPFTRLRHAIRVSKANRQKYTEVPTEEQPRERGPSLTSRS